MSRFPRFASMLLGLILTLAGTDAAAAPTEADQLREELRALKAENARQAELMRALEERIRALEKASTSSSVLAPPATPAAETLVDVDQVRVLVDREYQRDTESRDQSLLTAEHPYAGRVQEVLQGFMDIHGY